MHESCQLLLFVLLAHFWSLVVWTAIHFCYMKKSSLDFHILCSSEKKWKTYEDE